MNPFLKASGDPQKSQKSQISEAKMELSWTKNGTQIALMLKTAYGAEILRFPKEFHDF